MGVPRNVEQEEEVVEAGCTASVLEHIEVLMSALTMFGLGIACEREYQALLIVAETAKLLHGHQTFDPAPEAEKLAASARAAMGRTAPVFTQKDSPVFPAPDTGKVH